MNGGEPLVGVHLGACLAWIQNEIMQVAAAIALGAGVEMLLSRNRIEGDIQVGFASTSGRVGMLLLQLLKPWRAGGRLWLGGGQGAREARSSAVSSLR